MFLVMSCKSLRVCGTFAGPRRSWRLFTLPGHRNRQTGFRRLGVPTGLCASTVACMLQDRGCFNWSEHPPEIIILSTFEEAIAAISANKSVQAFFWECTAVELLAARTICMEAMAPVQAPWLSHVFVCGREALFTKAATMKHFFQYTTDLCADMLTTDVEETRSYMHSHYGFTDEDCKAWLQDASWACTPDIDWCTVTRPAEYLTRLNLVDCHFSAGTHLAPGHRVLGGPAPELGRPQAAAHRHAINKAATAHEGCDELDQGAPAAPGAPRVHHLLPHGGDDCMVTPEEALRPKLCLLGSETGAYHLFASQEAEPVPAG